MKVTDLKTTPAHSRAKCGISAAILQLLKNAPPEGLAASTMLAELAGRFHIRVDQSLLSQAISQLHPYVSAEGAIVSLNENQLASKESFFQERKELGAREKQAVAAHIHDELLDTLDAIFMDAGSACEAIAWEMALGEKGRFTVMTNNMRAVKAFLRRRSIRMRITGGTYVVDDEALVGDGAVFSPDQYSVKHAIVGASGITATHVYNHGITGEEMIKRAYWLTPAQLLIVPATLRKFGGKDASCFGELFKAKKEIITPDGPVSVFKIVHQTIEDLRLSKRDRSNAFSLHQHVPRFTAEKCVIVIEPEWLIDEVYPNKQDRNALIEVVREINHNSPASCVEVIHSTTTPDRLSQSIERMKSVAD